MGKRKRRQGKGRGSRRNAKKRKEPLDPEFIRRVRNKLWLVFFAVLAAIALLHIVGPPLWRWTGLSKLKFSSPPTYQPYVPYRAIPGSRPVRVSPSPRVFIPRTR